ncbi:hypothetical protein CRG98_028566 [Punica granatum]|uniref:Uncharacterized protein n=1 Tax=Punica granatum TaxID=22663 RepID=A0A2I0J486_PUNGR|nr:hypothetical protein CRG98_028566 [Punica granatum]
MVIIDLGRVGSGAHCRPKKAHFEAHEWLNVRIYATHITGSNAPNHRSRGPTPPCTPSARNPSAEWGLAPSHHSTPSNVYVEDDLDRVCESWLEITRELERSNGYRENRSTLASLVGLVGPDRRLPEPALP